MPDAVRLEHVSKRFVLRHERQRTFQEAAIALFHPRRAEREEFWALRDVTFAVPRGRTLGIVGRNGSGKSTLLKLLVRTLRPTSGIVQVDGRVFGLLELGAGFHPDLTGRENIFLNGSFLGIARQELARRLDDIVGFAELEHFIDTPVKHYSSGMHMRLGFAIAVNVEPDVLVVDEVLAVGDASFRHKCYAALAEFKREHKTILFVSHDTGAVARFCDEALWLDAGRVRLTGRPDEVVKAYLDDSQTRVGLPAVYGSGGTQGPHQAGDLPRWGNGLARFATVQVLDATGLPRAHFAAGEPAVVRLQLSCARSMPDLMAGVALHRGDGLLVFSTTTAPGPDLTPAQGESTIDCVIDALAIGEGAYHLSAGLWRGDRWQTPEDMWPRAAHFHVDACPTRGAVALSASWQTGSVVSAMAQPAAAALGARARPEDRELPLPPRKTRGDERVPVGGAGDGRSMPLISGDQRVCWSPPPSRLIIGDRDEEFLGDGWYVVEDWPPRVRWTTHRATVYLRKRPEAWTLGLALCRPFHDARVACGRVLLNGEVVGTFQLATPQFQDVTFPLPSGDADADRAVEVTIEVDDPIVPAQLGLSEDPRLLGVAVREVWLE